MSRYYTNVVTMGNHVLVREIEDGKRTRRKSNHKPRLYTKSKSKTTKFRTLFNEPLDEIVFGDIKDFKEFKEQYKDVENFKLYGEYRHDYAYMSEAYPKDIIADLSAVCIAYVDIEVGSEHGFPEPDKASEPITAITVHVGGKFWAFGCGDYKSSREDVVYTKCKTEETLIRKFLEVWTTYYPDIVTGWNTNLFDFPYLINRMNRLGLGSDGEDITKTLSPWNWIKERSFHNGKKEITVYDIAGIAMIDYIDLYKKYGPPNKQESYKLDYIGFVEVGTQKIDYSEYEDLYTLYKRDFQKFIDYNIRDVEIVMKIEIKNRLLELAMTLAYDSRVNYEDVFSQVRMWDSIIYNDLKRKGIMMPPKKDSAKRQQFEGAYVKDPRPGMYHWLASFDFTSLYPHLIMMYNLSPETLVEPVDYDQEIEDWMDENRSRVNVDNMLDQSIDTAIFAKKNLIITPNCQVFRRETHGFLAELMDTMYKDRARYKKMMTQAKRDLENEKDPTKRQEIEFSISRYNNLQQTKKVCLNSAYGAIGNQYFRFFDVRIAEAVTLSAQLSVRWIQKHLNLFIDKLSGQKGGDYVVASDTDSVYVTFKALVDKVHSAEEQQDARKIIHSLDKVCDKVISPQIAKMCQALSDYVNAYEQKLDMKREALADKAIWTKKKHYMINVYNNEGVEYAKPKLKITGMAAIKSTTPAICRAKVKEAFELIISGKQEEVRELVNNFREEFMAQKITDIANPMGMNGLDDYDGGAAIYKKKTPIHVKGALIYNHWLRKLELTKKYQEIKEGEKLRFVYLKEPNPLQSEVVSFTTVIPKEFELDKYVDYNTMFEKTFLNQVEKVTEVIGWELEQVSTLENLFG